MKKRLLAWLLCLCLIMGLLPVTALAVSDSSVYQGLTISCDEGNVGDKVKLKVAYSGGESRASIVFEQNGTYTVSGTWDTTIWDGYANMGAVLIVNEGVQADITLRDVTIRPDQAIATQNANSSGICCKANSGVTLRLSGDNTIYGRNEPAIEIEGSADVTITGDGSLKAVCGKGINGAGGRYPGIGVSQSGGGTLTIHGGTIYATGDLTNTGSPGGPGIGDNGVMSGAVLKCIVIEEKDGYTIDLTTTGGKGAPGIGSMSSSASSNSQILIHSGHIVAQAGEKNGYYGSAGIGGGDNWIDSSVDPGLADVQIEISGGEITAKGTQGGAGIGGGYGTAPTIRITGGTVHVAGGSWAAGIGAGYQGNDGSVTITGGKITAMGGNGGAGVGGSWSSTGTDVTIGGTAVLTAVGGGKGEGIGCGENGSAGTVMFSDTPQVLSGSPGGLAVNQNASSSGCAILNSQFMTELPSFISIVDESGKIVKEIDNIPQGLKSMACTLENKAQTIRVGREDKTFAYIAEDGQDVFDWNIQPNQVLTRMGLSWKEMPFQGHTITATAGPNGSISPSDAVTVTDGADQTFTIIPASGYHIEDVLVDNQSVGAVSSYTFENVVADHTISATFDHNSSGGGGTTRYTIKAEAQKGGSIFPSGRVRVDCGDDQTFRITADEGYEIEDVLVDGYSVGTVERYTFENIRSSHTIEAVFEAERQTADPDETGVSGWLNTKDHFAYLTGYDTGTFGPNNNMTRAEVAQMFYNLLRNKEVPITVNFTDVAPDTWYARAVNILGSLGIITGVGNNQFEPDRAITRAEFTAIAMRFAKLDTSGENIFSDVSADDWFYGQVVGSIKYGWITGYEDSTFRPLNTITRAEVTTIVNQMLGRAADVDYVDAHMDKLRQFPDVLDSDWAYYQIMEATNDHGYTKSGSVEDWTELKQ